MHTYDYSFLGKLSLPEPINLLIASLHRKNEGLRPRGAAAEEIWTRSAQAAARLDAVDAETYAQILREIYAQNPAQPVKPDEVLHILQILLPHHTPDETLKQSVGLAVSAYNLAPAVDPLLLIPCFSLDLTCAFADIPGSQSAVLAVLQLLLHHSGFSLCRFASLEECICTYRYFYQRSLARASAHWQVNGSNYLCYVEIFLSILYLCGKKLPVPIRKPRGSKRAAIEALVLAAASPISKAEICAALPEISPTTVEAALGSMVRSGIVQRVGAARSARYIRALEQSSL